MLNKRNMIIVLLIVIIPSKVYARRGCCSHHGGVSGCSSSGNQICADGSLSPTCTCTPSYVYGCTDKSAYNYNSYATKDDGSCKYYRYGCTDIKALNYDSEADKDDGSCEYDVYGCMYHNAKNYNPKATKDDGSCIYADNNEKMEVSNTADDKSEEGDSSALVPVGIIALAGGGYIYKKRIRNK